MTRMTPLLERNEQFARDYTPVTLGPPTAQLRRVDRLAVRACQGFEQGARYLATAARFMGPDGAATDQQKVNGLLHRGAAGVNMGSNLMSRAVADGSVIGSPG